MIKVFEDDDEIYNTKRLLIYCFRCHMALEEPGGLLFSHPDKVDRVQKYHLCIRCYAEVMDFIDKHEPQR